MRVALILAVFPHDLAGFYWSKFIISLDQQMFHVKSTISKAAEVGGTASVVCFADAAAGFFDVRSAR